MVLIGKVMSSPVIGAETATTILEAAEKMRVHDVGTLPVFDGQKPIGIVTDRDIVTRILSAQGLSFGPDNGVVRIMSRDVITCFADQKVVEAAVLMGELRIRRLLVVDRSGAPVGILSVGDIAEHVSEELAGQILGEISEARARDKDK